eukprot:scaffold424_cov69-Phaeocystis_antarctica.AAC.13
MPKVASEAAHELGITTGSKSLAELIHEVHAKLASVYCILLSTVGSVYSLALNVMSYLARMFRGATTQLVPAAHRHTAKRPHRHVASLRVPEISHSVVGSVVRSVG